MQSELLLSPITHIHALIYFIVIIMLLYAPPHDDDNNDINMIFKNFPSSFYECEVAKALGV